MAQTSRPLVAVVLVAFVLVAVYLLIAQPQAQPPNRSKTPLAPLQAIEQAQGAAAASDAANQRLRAAGEQFEAP